MPDTDTPTPTPTSTLGFGVIVALTALLAAALLAVRELTFSRAPVSDGDAANK